MPGLGAEPCGGVRVLGEFITQQFDGHRTVKYQVHGAPHGTHTARGDQVIQPVPGR